MAFVTLFQHRALSAAQPAGGRVAGRCGCSAKRAVSHCDSARLAVWFGPSWGAMRAMWLGCVAFVIKFHDLCRLRRGRGGIAVAAAGSFDVEIFNNQDAYLTDTDCRFTYFYYICNCLEKNGWLGASTGLVHTCFLQVKGMWYVLYRIKNINL